MERLGVRLFVVGLVGGLAVASVPASGASSVAGSVPVAASAAANGDASAAKRRSARRAKRTCRVVKAGRGARGKATKRGKRAAKRPVCKKRKPKLVSPGPVGGPSGTPEPGLPAPPVPGLPAPPLPGLPAPPLPGVPGPGLPGLPAPGPAPQDPGPTDPGPDDEYERVDLIVNNDFEDPEDPGCFDSSGDAVVEPVTDDPIAGARSLGMRVSGFTKLICAHEYPFQEGPQARAVTLEGDVRIDSAPDRAQVEVCTIVYFENTQQTEEACRTLSAANQGIVHLELVRGIEDRAIQRVFFQFETFGKTVRATLDNAHLWVDQLKGSAGPSAPGPGPGPGGGGGGGSSNGRFVELVSPTDGQTFTTDDLDLRLVGVGYDPNVFTNHPTSGHGTNAARLEFLVDGTVVYAQDGADAEYDVFKGFANDLQLAPGPHTVVARATYEDPALVRESAPVTINVEAPPAYAQTVNLTQDVVIGAGQSYEQIGAPGARIRLNGNGHRIVANGTSGRLTLKHVDVYDLGNPGNTASPGIDVTTSGSNSSITIEDTVFDGSNPIRLRLDASSRASIKRNELRSNMRMPLGQQPGPDASTVPVLAITGTSTAQKAFSGNNVGAGPVHFEDASHWTIGGTSDAESNVIVGPRAALEVVDCDEMAVKGNYVEHVYWGGWSQGQLLELQGTNPVSVQHNVLIGGSWPVRGIGGEMAYNLILNAGHMWVWPENGAYIHHNVFAGGDNDWGGIVGFSPIDARIESNTFDDMNGAIERGGSAAAAISWEEGHTTLRSNAFLRWPGSTIFVVELIGGTIDAGYNGFFNRQEPNYSDGRTPANDVGGGAATDPRFAGPLPADRSFGIDRGDVWQRTLTVSEILAGYRARYTPAAGSPYIDAGDPAGGPGNDVGAVGAGAGNTFDQFGRFGP